MFFQNLFFRLKDNGLFQTHITGRSANKDAEITRLDRRCTVSVPTLLPTWHTLTRTSTRQLASSTTSTSKSRYSNCVYSGRIRRDRAPCAPPLCIPAALAWQPWNNNRQLRRRGRERDGQPSRWIDLAQQNFRNRLRAPPIKKLCAQTCFFQRITATERRRAR